MINKIIQKLEEHKGIIAGLSLYMGGFFVAKGVNCPDCNVFLSFIGFVLSFIGMTLILDVECEREMLLEEKIEQSK